MVISFELPDQFLPALLAEYLIVSTAGGTSAESPEEYFIKSIVETVRQRAEIYKVGPYFEGTAEPRFLADGMPNPAYTRPDAIVLPYDEEEEGLPPDEEEDLSPDEEEEGLPPDEEDTV